MSQFSFRRSNLAVAYCDSLEGKGIAHARSGLFLAGPRRVGKSTFLIEDLIPETKKRRWTSVYIDLWTNKKANPATLIADVIKRKIVEHENRFAKMSKTIKLNKMNILGTFILDFAQPGLPDNVSLTDALYLLYQCAKNPILLIIDEAQHALMTESGLNTMYALKSARDQLNLSQAEPILMLAFTGSSRDKLAQLAVKKESPFFGSQISTFPSLGRDFTDAFTEWVNQGLSHQNQFTHETMWQAFKMTGYRPEILRHIVGQIALNGEAHYFADLLKKDALVWHDHIWDEFETLYLGLTVLQQAIMQVIMDKGIAWSPFSEDSIHLYKELTGNNEIATATIQSAIQGLRERGLIWQSGRGSYMLEDESFAEWFKHYESKQELVL